MVALLEGRVRAVDATLDVVADHEGHAAGAMVGPGAVVLDAPAELREEEERRIVACVVLVHVVHEVADGRREFRPQLVMSGELARVGVVAALLGVVDARAEVGKHHLRGVAEVLPNRGRGVLDVGRVLVHGGSENVRALERVGSRLSEELHDGVAAVGGAVHLGEGIEDCLAAALIAHVSEEAVGLEVADGGHGNAALAERPRQATPEVDRSQDILAVRIELLSGATEPALVADVLRQGSVPDVHGAEVRAVGVRVADAMDDGDLPLVPEPLDGLHARTESGPVVDGQDIFGLDVDRTPEVVVEPVAVGHDGVEIVVSAAELDDHQLVVIGCRCHVRSPFRRIGVIARRHSVYDVWGKSTTIVLGVQDLDGGLGHARVAVFRGYPEP